MTTNYDARMSVRKVAEEVGVSVGTVINYLHPSGREPLIR